MFATGKTEIILRPFRAFGMFCPHPQGVALGWILGPLRGPFWIVILALTFGGHFYLAPKVSLGAPFREAPLRSDNQAALTATKQC